MEIKLMLVNCQKDFFFTSGEHIKRIDKYIFIKKSISTRILGLGISVWFLLEFMWKYSDVLPS